LEELFSLGFQFLIIKLHIFYITK